MVVVAQAHWLLKIFAVIVTDPVPVFVAVTCVPPPIGARLTIPNGEGVQVIVVPTGALLSV